MASIGTIFDDLIFVIITFGYFIKCVFGPLLLRYGSYSSMFEDTNRKEMDLAILLLLCEIVAIYIFIINQKNKLRESNSMAKTERDTNNNSGYDTSLFKLTVILLTIATLLIVISHPYYLNEYSSIFSPNFRITDHPENSPLFTVFSCVFPMVNKTENNWSQSNNTLFFII